jgi:phosphotriesterase-related protein
VGLLGLLATAPAPAAPQADVEARFRAEHAGRILTLRGPMDAEDAGIVLPHEHVFLDLSLPFDDPQRWQRAGRRPPAGDEDRRVYDLQLRLDNWAEVRRLLWRTRDPLVLDDYAIAVQELRAFRAAGGTTLVDVTTVGLGRDPERLLAVARDTGLNMVIGTGWYREGWRPVDFDGMDVEALADVMVREIVHGIDDTGLHAGVIGEIPAMDLATGPDSTDVRQLRAAARASQRTGAAITLHQWVGDGTDLFKTLDILAAEGADLSRVIVGHIGGDAMGQLPILERALARGVTLQFDLLGVPFLLEEPVDDTRGAVEAIAILLRGGYAGQLMMSQDVCTKVQLKHYGGNGYDYVLTEVLPWLRQQHGIEESMIRRMVIDNPARLFALAPTASGS